MEKGSGLPCGSLPSLLKTRKSDLAIGAEGLHSGGGVPPLHDSGTDAALTWFSAGHHQEEPVSVASLRGHPGCPALAAAPTA